MSVFPNTILFVSFMFHGFCFFFFYIVEKILLVQKRSSHLLNGVCVFLFFFSPGLCSRDVSVKSRCLTLTPLALQVAVIVDWTPPVRRAVFRASESGGRTLEVMATPLKTDLMGTSSQISLRDTVSNSLIQCYC